jgi:hypothetical protein
MVIKITNPIARSMAYAPTRRPITSVGFEYVIPNPAPGMYAAPAGGGNVGGGYGERGGNDGGGGGYPVIDVAIRPSL